MKQVILPDTDLRLSRFSFGTASLFKVGSQKARQYILSAACDNGFTHFDTAPYYGFGIAEKDLRHVLSSHPNISVATKVGIYSPGGESQSAYSVFFRKTAGKIFSSLSKPTIDWSIARAKDSLSASLKRLGRERIDLYFLHEPDFSLINTEEWLRWLENEKDRVRYFGIAVDNTRLAPFIAANTPLARVVQTVDSNNNCEADIILKSGRQLQITYGYVSAAQRYGVVNFDSILMQALQRNTTGSIIVSTKKVSRLAQYTRILETGNPT